MRKLKNGKATGREEVNGVMVKGGGELVISWILKLCNMAFSSSVVPEDRSFWDCSMLQE